MPTPSALPYRLQVINRIVTVLQAISAGSTYWNTPRVYKRYYLPQELSDTVVYMVFPTAGGGVELAGAAGASSTYDEDMIVNVHCCVRDSFDTTTLLEKALHDARTAIDADARDKSTAGSLGVLDVEARMEEGPEMESTCLDAMGIGLFNLKIRCKIVGTYAEL